MPLHEIKICSGYANFQKLTCYIVVHNNYDDMKQRRVDIDKIALCSVGISDCFIKVFFDHYKFSGSIFKVKEVLTLPTSTFCLWYVCTYTIA